MGWIGVGGYRHARQRRDRHVYRVGRADFNPIGSIHRYEAGKLEGAALRSPNQPHPIWRLNRASEGYMVGLSTLGRAVLKSCAVISRSGTSGCFSDRDATR